MKEIMNNIMKSFKGNADGFSSRKLTAFIIIILVIVIHIKWITLGDLSQLEMVLTIDYSFIAALFGMTTFSSLKTQSKSSSSTVEQENTEDSKKTTITNQQTGGDMSNK